jgi:hypothetical protein
MAFGLAPNFLGDSRNYSAEHLFFCQCGPCPPYPHPPRSALFKSPGIAAGAFLCVPDMALMLEVEVLCVTGPRGGVTRQWTGTADSHPDTRAGKSGGARAKQQRLTLGDLYVSPGEPEQGVGDGI